MGESGSCTYWGKDDKRLILIVWIYARKIARGFYEKSWSNDSPMRRGRGRPKMILDVIKRNFRINDISKNLIWDGK